MKQQDWIDYFEAINGRSPEAQELEAARASGEITEDAVPVPPQQAPVTPQAAQSAPNQATAGTTPPQEPIAATVQNFAAAAQANPQVQEWKQKGNAYANWALQSLKNPISSVKNGNFVYSAVTIAASSVALALAMVFFFRRMFQSILNLSIAGESLRVHLPEKYDSGMRLISEHFGVTTILKLSAGLAAFYVAAILLPALFSRFSQKTASDLKSEFAKASQFSPILLLINLLAFVSTFLIPQQVNISKEAAYSVNNLFSAYRLTEPLDVVNQFLKSATHLPLLKSILQSGQIIVLIGFIGFLVLLVALIKNTNTSYKQINTFYVSILLTVVLSVAVFYLNKYNYSILLESLKGVLEFFEISNLF